MLSISIRRKLHFITAMVMADYLASLIEAMKGIKQKFFESESLEAPSIPSTKSFCTRPSS